MSAPYSPAAVANEFLLRGQRESRPITPLQLQKLTYITYGWYLGVTGEKLFDESVEAWDHGPVIPSLFHEFKKFGREPITRLAHTAKDLGFDASEPFIREDDTTATQLVDWVWKSYGGKSGGQLRKLTHMSGTPWDVTKKKVEIENNGVWISGQVIDAELIKQHYQDLWAKWAKVHEYA